jgi:transposase InsO family protein
MAIPQDRNLRWSLDFVADTLASGRRFRILTLVDDFTRECLGLVVDTSLTGELDRIMEVRGCPRMIVSDNGTELTSNAVLAWQQQHAIEWHYIAPGKPMQNGFVESFNGRLRRVPQRAPVHQSQRSARDHRRMEDRLQHQLPAHEPQRAHTDRVRSTPSTGAKLEQILLMNEGKLGSRSARPQLRCGRGVAQPLALTRGRGVAEVVTWQNEPGSNLGGFL